MTDPLEQGYTVYHTPASGSRRKVFLVGEPDLRRSFGAKYDTCVFKADQSLGDAGFAVKDRVEVFEDGVLVLNGLIVNKPGEEYGPTSASVEVMVASMPYILWKKTTREKSFDEDDIRVLKNFFQKEGGKGFDLEDLDEFEATSKVAAVDGRLQLAKVDATTFHASGHVESEVFELGAEIDAVTVEGTPEDHLSRSKTLLFEDEENIDEDASDVEQDPFEDVARLPDRTETNTHEMTDDSETVDVENVKFEDGQLQIAGNLFSDNFEDAALADFHGYNDEHDTAQQTLQAQGGPSSITTASNAFGITVDYESAGGPYIWHYAPSGNEELRQIRISDGVLVNSYVVIVRDAGIAYQPAADGGPYIILGNASISNPRVVFYDPSDGSFVKSWSLSFLPDDIAYQDGANGGPYVITLQDNSGGHTVRRHDPSTGSVVDSVNLANAPSFVWLDTVREGGPYLATSRNNSADAGITDLIEFFNPATGALVETITVRNHIEHHVTENTDGGPEFYELRHDRRTIIRRSGYDGEGDQMTGPAAVVGLAGNDGDKDYIGAAYLRDTGPVSLSYQTVASDGTISAVTRTQLGNSQGTTAAANGHAQVFSYSGSTFVKVSTDSGSEFFRISGPSATPAATAAGAAYVHSGTLYLLALDGTGWQKWTGSTWTDTGTTVFPAAPAAVGTMSQISAMAYLIDQSGALHIFNGSTWASTGKSPTIPTLSGTAAYMMSEGGRTLKAEWDATNKDDLLVYTTTPQHFDLATVGTGRSQSLKIEDEYRHYRVQDVGKVGSVVCEAYPYTSKTLYLDVGEVFRLRRTTGGDVEWYNGASDAWEALPTAGTLPADQWGELEVRWDTQDADPVNWTFQVFVRGDQKGTVSVSDSSGEASVGYVSWGRTGDADQEFALDSILLRATTNPNVGLEAVAEFEDYTATEDIQRAYLEATHTKPAGSSILYEASVDGGSTWAEITPTTDTDDPEWFDVAKGDRSKTFRIRVTLTAPDDTALPTVDQVDLTFASGYEANQQRLLVTPNVGDGETNGANIEIKADSDVTVPTGATITWRVSSNGGDNWTAHSGPGNTATIPSAERGTDIRIEATLESTDAAVTPKIGDLQIVIAEPAADTTTVLKVSRDGGETFHVATFGSEFDFTDTEESPKNQFVLRIELSTNDTTASPSVSDLSFTLTGPGFTYVQLGATGSEVVSRAAAFDVSYFHQSIGKELLRIVQRFGINAFWVLDPSDGVYTFHYNVDPDLVDHTGVMGEDILELQANTYGEGKADTLFIVRR